MKKDLKKITTVKSNGFRIKQSVTNGKAPEKNKTRAATRKKNNTINGHTIKKMTTAQELSILLNNTEESIVVIATDFTILTYNVEFKKLNKKFFNRTVNKGDSILDYTQSGRREIVEQIYLKVFSGEKMESEIELTGKDNDSCIFSNRFKPAYDENENLIGATVITVDITDKKRSAQLLIANEQRYRKLVENSNDGIIILSPDGGAKYVSPSVESILGYTEEEALQLDMYTLFHPDDVNIGRDTMEKVMSNPGVAINGGIARVRHKNGSWRWLEATITNMLHEPSINGIVDNFRDVTEKILAEQELKQSREQLKEERKLLRTLIDNLPINVYTKDLQSRKTLANRNEYTYSGFDREEDVLGKTDYELFSEQSARETLEEDHMIINTGESIIGKEKYHITKDGVDTWFLISKIPLKNEQGKVNGLLGISFNINDRKEAEEKIRIAKERYDIVSKATNEAIWDWDILTDNIQWNEGFRLMFGYDPAEESDVNAWTAHIHPDDVQRVIDSLMQVVCSPDQSKWDASYRYMKNDGSYAQVADRGFVIRNAEGRPTRMIGGMQNMTEKIKADQELRDSEEKTRLIMNAALDAIICMDTAGAITFWNPKAEKIFGWKAEEVMGKVLSEIIIPANYRHLHNKGREKYLQTGHGPALNVLLELSAINRDKKEFPIELSILPIKQENKEEFFCAFIRDITARKQIKEQLSDAYKFNQTIIETSPVGIWIYEESGQAITVNQAGMDLSGATSQELLSHNFRELESWKKSGLYDAAIEALETGKIIRREIHSHNVLNEEVWYEALLTPVHFKGKKHLILMTYDIKERMNAETALKKSEAQLSVATQLAKLGYWELNIAEGIFTFNDHFYSILKTTTEEMGGHTMSAELYGQRFLHPDDGPMLQEEIKNAIETTDPNYSRSLEHRIIYPNGQIGYLAVRFFVVKDENGRTIKTVGANQDITEQVLAAEQIRAVKERYELVHQATNDVIYEWDIVNDVNYWGEGYETLFGHTRTGEKMPTETWVDNLHPDEKDELFSATYEAFKNKETSLSRELRFRCADGSYKTVFDNLIILYNEQQQPIKIIGAMQDITELKKNEVAIRELNENLNKRAGELAASNEELERFAYVASHDLQEPLRMVSSFLQLLQKKYESLLDETGSQYINFAVDGADRMKRLILDLLEYSRVGTNQDKQVHTDIGEIATQVMDIFADKIHETGAVIKIHSLPSIKVNASQITQLIQNLVGNAFKYNTSAIPEIEIGCEEKKDAWQFFVKDNGIGIDPRFFDKVFIIFQRLHNKNQFSGTGIGLAICKKIVEKHGGNIWIESSPGNGSRFLFTIKK
jgi:PAS domain S-box-containing protein